MAAANLERRLLAAAGALVATVEYTSVFSTPTGGAATLIVPAVTALIHPPTGVAALVLTFLVQLYYSGKLFLLLALLPFLLLYVAKSVHSWEAALALLLITPAVVAFPELTGIMLGFLFYLSSKEKPRESVFTALCFVTNMMVTALLTVNATVYEAPLLTLPGGFGNEGGEQVSRAVLFYATLANRLATDSKLLVELTLLAISVATPSLVSEATLAPMVLPQLLLLLNPLLSGTLREKDIVAVFSSVTTSLALLGAEKTAPRVFSSFRAIISIPYRRKKAEVVKEDLGVVFSDLSDLASELRMLCEALPLERNIVVLGVSADEEREFAKYALKDTKCRCKLYFFHDLGMEGLEKLRPSTTIVIYVRIPEWRFSRRVISRLTGFDEETVERVTATHRDVLLRISRTALYRLVKIVEEEIERGRATREAFAKALSIIEPELSEEFVRVLEEIQSRYEVIGFLARKRE